MLGNNDCMLLGSKLDLTLGILVGNNDGIFDGPIDGSADGIIDGHMKMQNTITKKYQEQKSILTTATSQSTSHLRVWHRVWL